MNFYHSSNLLVFVEIFSPNYPSGTIMIFLISHPSSKRAKFAENNWGNQFMEIYGKDNLFVLSSGGFPETNLHCLDYSEDYHQIKNSKSRYYHDNIDRAAKRAFSADYFLNTGRAKWLIVLTDDVIIDVKKLNNYVEFLESEYGDPMKTQILEGNCIGRNRVYTFIQGGSGFIMSYKSAEVFSAFSKKWVSETTLPDDVHFSLAIQRMGLDIKKCTSNKFIGHQLQNYYNDILIKKEYYKLEDCTEMRNDPYCGSFLSPLNDLIFLHQSPNPESTSILAKAIFDGIPNNILWYQEADTVKICKKKN